MDFERRNMGGPDFNLSSRVIIKQLVVKGAEQDALCETRAIIILQNVQRFDAKVQHVIKATDKENRKED